LSFSGASRPNEQSTPIRPATALELASFLPAVLLARIHGNRSALPAAITFPAAVMFADVSRYTGLVEQSAHRGLDTLEKIPELLGRSYSHCIEQIYDSGGEVLWLAGDTLVGYWPADGCELGDAVQKALECAKKICGGRSGTPGRVKDPATALHIGIGAGQLWAAALGGRSLWNLVTAGEAVMEAAASHSVAGPWQYVLGDGANRALALRPEARADGQHRLSSDHSPDLPWLAGFLPPSLRATFFGASTPAIRDGGSDVALSLDTLSENRPVTVLFARMIGLDHRSPDALAHHHELCAALQQELQAHGGPPGELLFDDKGLVLMAAFGAHGYCHHDDPIRAIDSALGIMMATRRLGLAASIGLATGETLFRVIGNARRRQLMIFGAPVNRAARLMSQAAGVILCDAPTERASRTVFRFESCGTLQLTGLSETTAIFRPFERQIIAPAAALPIGRQAELDFLNRAFDEVRDENRRCIVVMGEPGIGKSTLVAAFAERLRKAGGEVSVAGAERDDRQTSLLPWRRVLASLLHLDPDSAGAEVFAALSPRASAHSGTQERLPLLADILGFEVAQTEATRHLSGPHRADATMRLVADLIAAIAPRPLVIVLEDSQWLDSASWRLFEWILASQPSLLMILCVRSGEVPDELKILLRRAEILRTNPLVAETDDPARVVCVLDLAELGANLIAEIVARTLGEAAPHRELARHIAELAGGNPLFAEEITLALRSDGLIAIRDGLWRPIRPLDALRYFDRVERAIRERVDRLQPDAQTVLKAAAVIGRSFGRDALAVLLRNDIDEPALSAAMELLMRAHLVRATRETGICEFRHDQIRDVVYGSIPGDVRQRLHGTLAKWLESANPPTGSGDIAALVRHFEAAGDFDRAVKYADIAATKALQTGAFREVISFVDICFGHEPKQMWNSEQRLQAVRWRRQFAEAQNSLGDVHAQGVAVRRALRLAGEPIPDSAAALLGRFISGGFRLVKQELCGQTQSRSDFAVQWDRELCRCLNQAASADYFELRFARAFYDTIAAAVHAGRTSSSTEQALAAAQLAVGLGILGWRGGAQHFILRAELAATGLGDPAIHARICNLDALWRIGHGDWPNVDGRLDQAQTLCLAAGDTLTWCNAQAIRFWSQYYRGEFGVLEHTAQQLLSRAQNSGNIQQEVWALRCKSLCALQTDRPREAVEFLRLSTAASRGSADLSERISSLGALAVALSRVGLHGESVPAATETLDLLRNMKRPTVHSTLPGLSGIAEVFVRGREAGLSHEYGEWAQWERRSLYELRRFAAVFPIGIPQYCLWAGVAQWLNGRHNKAIRNWTRALKVARQMSLRHDQSLISAEIRRREIRI
jgi:class 3 adenylate cyclase/energy-coupling factor transporter ATP-binding protein EcfA2